jgi:hypothetical protein
VLYIPVDWQKSKEALASLPEHPPESSSSDHRAHVSATWGPSSATFLKPSHDTDTSLSSQHTPSDISDVDGIMPKSSSQRRRVPVSELSFFPPRKAPSSAPFSFQPRNPPSSSMPTRTSPRIGPFIAPNSFLSKPSLLWSKGQGLLNAITNGAIPPPPRAPSSTSESYSNRTSFSDDGWSALGAGILGAPQEPLIPELELDVARDDWRNLPPIPTLPTTPMAPIKPKTKPMKTANGFTSTIRRRENASEPIISDTSGNLVPATVTSRQPGVMPQMSIPRRSTDQ